MAKWADTSAASYEEAVQVVLQGLGRRLDPRKCLWCNYPVLWHDKDVLDDKVEKDWAKLVREECKRFGEDEDDFCYDHRWYVGIPQVKVVRRGLPHLAWQVDLYYVNSDDNLAAWGRLVPKADTFEVPVALMQGLLAALPKGELEPEGADLVERADGYTIYRLTGSDRDWKVPDAFLGFLWALAEKGKGWEGLLDRWTSKALAKTPTALPAVRAGGVLATLPPPDFKEDDFLAALTGLSIPKAEARQLLTKVPHDVPLEQAIQEALKLHAR